MSQSLVTIGKSNFELRHLLVIGILILSFSISFMIRSQGADFGYELNEFDPFFNYRATEYIVDNGLSEYFEWHDDLSWYPEGRNVSATSQVMLHITAALTYQAFASNSSLYEYTILFPVIFGSLTTIVIFALVRVIGGTTAGLFASLLFSVSLPIILRGMIGWFKSEPLGIFFGILGLYFFLSGIRSENRKIAVAKLVAGGIILSFGLASWGGIQFFIIPIGMFIFTLPFLRKDHGFVIWSIPLFVASFLLSVSAFERPGLDFVFGLGGVSLIGPAAFLIACIIIQKFSSDKAKLRNGLVFLIAIIVIGSAIITINAESEFLPLPSFRYLNAINPFLTTDNPLVDSVAEHATTTLSQSFYFHSILMIFAGIGIWLILSNRSESTLVKNDMIAFSLIVGLTGVYVSSAFVRLEVFASIALIILASIGLAILTKEIFKSKKLLEKPTLDQITKFSFIGLIVVLLIIPLTFPSTNWVTGSKAPPTILNGGTNYGVITNDWLSSLEWIKQNTPQDAVVASWWDYGYWISTMSERATLTDNATLDSKKIAKTAKIMLSTPDDAWNELQEMGADYFVVFVAGQRIDQGQDQPLYLITGGGDESKKQWFMRIAGESVAKYVHPDGISGTEHFWDNTMLGKLFPFSTLSYVNPRDTSVQSETFQMGLTPVYGKDIKYPTNGDGPFRFVYGSPSFTNESRILVGVFVYEINDDYIPAK